MNEYNTTLLNSNNKSFIFIYNLIYVDLTYPTEVIECF